MASQVNSYSLGMKCICRGLFCEWFCWSFFFVLFCFVTVWHCVSACAAVHMLACELLGSCHPFDKTRKWQMFLEATAVRCCVCWFLNCMAYRVWGGKVLAAPKSVFFLIWPVNLPWEAVGRRTPSTGNRATKRHGDGQKCMWDIFFLTTSRKQCIFLKTF